MKRLELVVVGTVQGVGFRPFVQREARARGLAGSVGNTARGVVIDVQGERVDELVALLAARATIERAVELPPGEPRDFVIVPSTRDGEARASLPPDLGPCAACATEIAAPGRRHRYPFTSCTACGPRASIHLRGPWDRANTTMAAFPPCAACAAEYADPADHRCHAQTIACPACGPTLWLERAGERIADGAPALDAAIAALRDGAIVALQGVGGWQLLVDATSEPAVAELRRRKHREARPFAVLFADLEAADRACLLSPEERAALADPTAPIVLVRTRTPASLAFALAPSSRLTGAMLPASPLHALIAAGVGRPLVCTSGNLAEEPLCFEPDDARRRLGPIADLLLGHDRAIARPLDDSVVRVTPVGRVVIRRARGFAPRALPRHEPGPTVLALGGHLKTTVALAVRDEIWLSGHVGDLGAPAAIDRLERTARELVAAAGVAIDGVACDLHPGFASTGLAERLARELGAELVRVPHHAAHVAAVAAEHGLTRPLLGLAWDGMGLGEDGTLWGGEAILLDGARAERVAHLWPFALPGGEAALREPRRAALGVLAAAELPRGSIACWFAAAELELLERALARRVNAPRTSALGRLFDAVAAIVGLRGVARFEAEAAMELEQAALDQPDDVTPYPIAVERAIVDWRPTLRALLAELADGVPVARLSARFHASLAEAAAALARGRDEVALVGGCFQNARLLGATVRRLAAAGVTARLPRELPPGDGGLAVGQALLAARRMHVSRSAR